MNTHQVARQPWRDQYINPEKEINYYIEQSEWIETLHDIWNNLIS